jgi:UDP:flavonoid glycosyltransferase YjiC (YdhE family)
VETAWAPQLQILQHPSTGGFISHCGWNSSIESISAGVPVLTWHLHGDQPLNARYIVEWLNAGLFLRKPGSPSPVVRGEDVATAIKSLMIDEAGLKIRKNLAQYKDSAVRSMQADGSSRRNLQRFVDEILSH